jgi:pyruvate dehydrogenase E2 component (dihydrolipoamide acetyltransferase)/2-oxoglutarate dehydrogenase E2 component (dihydrolipoamide succinyltransferase)
MMPQLGMAQDADKIVSWLKSADDAITKGDALFEVETDKATMEVEAQADGFLTDVCAAEDDEVLVGAMIAHISNSAEDSVASPALDRAKDTGEDKGDSLPKGVSVTMPQLGVAQDTGLLVSWQKALGDPVAADDILFESRNWLCCTKPLKFEVPLSPDGFSPRPL